MSTAQRGVVAFVEWHDAEIESIFIDLSVEELSTVCFNHLPVYYSNAKDIFEIWSHRATLKIFGFKGAAIAGGYGEADYVSEARLYRNDTLFDERDFLPDTRLTIDTLEIVCGSGRRVTITCRELLLVLGEAVEHIEDWVGPLR